jgi:hypothetical protein
MKQNILNKTIALMLATSVVLNSGCTAGYVWKKDVYHPAANVRLRLSAEPQGTNVLVQYEECFAKSTDSHPRAYWLWPPETYQPVVQSRPRVKDLRATQTNRVVQTKPIFVKPVGETNLLAVPFISETNRVGTNGYCALVSPDQTNFKLWHNGILLDDYKLPVYTNRPPPSFKRVVMTPVSLTADAVIVAAAVAAVAVVASVAAAAMAVAGGGLHR